MVKFAQPIFAIIYLVQHIFIQLIIILSLKLKNMQFNNKCTLGMFYEKLLKMT